MELFQCIIISVSLQKNNTMAKKQKAPKWSNKDTELLNKRFDNGEIPYKHLSPENIRTVLKQFYPDRTYECFSKVIKQKAKKYILDFDLQNARRTGKFFFLYSFFYSNDLTLFKFYFTQTIQATHASLEHQHQDSLLMKLRMRTRTMTIRIATIVI